MKVLHVVPTYLPALRYGGPIYSVHGLCRAQAAQSHDVHVFTTNVDGQQDSCVPLGEPVDLDGVKVWYFPSRVLRRLYYAPRMHQALVKRVAEFDIVHLHSVFLWPTWAAARLARRAGVPYVLSPRGMLDRELVRRKSRWLKTLWIRLIEKRNLENAAAVHATSQAEERAMKAFGFRLRPVSRIANGVDAPDGSGVLALSADVGTVLDKGDYVLYLGRINWKKGLDRLIDAWDGRFECRLVIAGNDEDGDASALRERATSEDGANIEFIVRTVSAADKEALFRNARLFVLPSYSENFGNTVLESMVRGVPVLVTEEVGAAEIVDASGGGRAVAGSALRESIGAMLSNPDETREMGRRGRAYVLEHCTWDAVAGEMTRLYQACLQQAAHP